MAISAGSTQHYRLLGVPNTHFTLVLGLQWHALIGSDYPALARKKAREAKADVFAHAPSSVSVGTLKYNKSDGKPATAKKGKKGGAAAQQLHSGALALCAAFPNGLAIVKVAFEDHSVWVVGIRDGVVIARTDVLYPTMEDADYAIEQLKQRYPGQDFTTHSTDNDDTYANLLDLSQLYQGISSKTELQSLSFSLASVPGPIKLLLAIGVGAILIQNGFGQYHKWVNARAERAAAAQNLDPDEAWTSAIAATAASTRVDTQESWDQLLDTVIDAPPVIAYWAIGKITCKPAGAPNAWRWGCEAEYSRLDDNRKKISSNSTFTAAMPSTWSVKWESLDLNNITAVWSIPARSKPLDIKRAPPTSSLGPVWITSLQEVQGAFKTITNKGSGNIAIPAPTNPDGSPVGDPSSPVPILQTRPLVMNGPLRSFAIFNASTIPVRVLSFVATFTETKAGEQSADSKKSPLTESFAEGLVNAEVITNATAMSKK